MAEGAGSRPLSQRVLREAKRVLKAARELLAVEKQFTKGALARDRQGRPVLPGRKRPKPVAWCLLGAVLEAEHRLFGTRIVVGKTKAGQPEMDGPERAMYAAATLGVSCARRILAPRLRMEEAGDETHAGTRETRSVVGPLAALEPHELRAIYAAAVPAANDLETTSHEDALAALDYACDLIDNQLAERKARPRRRRETNAKPHNRDEQ